MGNGAETSGTARGFRREKVTTTDRFFAHLKFIIILFCFSQNLIFFFILYRKQIEDLEEEFRRSEAIRVSEQGQREGELENKRHLLDRMQVEAEEVRRQTIPIFSFFICLYNLLIVRITVLHLTVACSNL